MPRIDTHAHWFPPEWVELVAREGTGNGAEVKCNDSGEIVRFTAPGIDRAGFKPQYVGIPVRLEIMDAGRVDVHALSLTSPMGYWAKPEFGLKLARAFNDACSAAHLGHPGRFVGMATLPMQAPALALEEVARAAKLPGIRGVYMGTHVNGKNLDEKEFFPVYAKCEELGLPIFLHPVAPVGRERMRNYHLGNFLGNPLETGIAAASLVFGGVMDAFPKLDVMLPHAGGVFPNLIGRMDHGTTVRRECAHMTRPPSAYLRRFHYDTITHSDAILMNLIRQVGADRVVMGSDCPADMSYTKPVDVVERLPGLSAAERDAILGGNAARLLGLAR
ncbi:MAG: amidohydrolase [Burkholderiales bacterium]|nr:amidohydrolase [Burkholderiales bacterium]